MKVGIFTYRTIAPLHPRLASFQQFFERHGHSVECITDTTTSRALSRINWLSLWFFDFAAVRALRAKIDSFDVIVVCDLKYLPLVRSTFRRGIFTIYDTIDHNVELRLFQLEKKVPLARAVHLPLRNLFVRLEKKIASKANAITVNSFSLKEYFGGAQLLLYSSPFETFRMINEPTRPAALLYLGAFSRDKGAEEMLQLQRRSQLPFYIFGNILEKDLADIVKQAPCVHWKDRLGSAVLATEIESVLSHHFLFGLSMIHAAHYSYEVQEANKDIDYLALGLPIIGNRRHTTLEKIEKGCGLLHDDPALDVKLTDPTLRAALVQNCKVLYDQHYHSRHFEHALIKIMAQKE